MKNKLADLNDHLFAQLERLGDETLFKDKLDVEIARAKAITSVATSIIATGQLAIDAASMMQEYRLDAQTIGLPLLDKKP